MNVYMISGLGADRRAFSFLKLNPSFHIIYLDWIAPERNESLQDYAFRLGQKIDTTQPFSIIGLSLGGMIASEISTIFRPQKTILLSSISSYNELPLLYKLGGKLKLHKLLPKSVGHNPNFIMYWLFGLNNNDDKTLFKQILADSDPHFTKWAINAVTNWSKKQSSLNIIRIHGDNDRVLPITSFTPNYIVKKGGHLMVANRALEISEILNTILSE